MLSKLGDYNWIGDLGGLQPSAQILKYALTDKLMHIQYSHKKFYDAGPRSSLCNVKTLSVCTHKLGPLSACKNQSKTQLSNRLYCKRFYSRN
jgi:hypothetical protein